MKVLLVALLFFSIGMLIPQKVSASDLPDKASAVISYVSDMVKNTEAVGVARIVGNREHRTVVLGFSPIKATKMYFKIAGKNGRFCLDQVYEPKSLLSMLDKRSWYFGLGARANVGDGGVALVAGAVPHEVSTHYFAYGISVFGQWTWK